MRWKNTHGLLLLLGLGRVVRGGRSAVRLGGISLAVGLGLADLTGDGLAATATSPLLDAPLLLLLVLLIGGFGHLDDHGAALELLLVEELDSLLRGLCGVQGNKPIACGACATQDDLGRDAGRPH